MTRGERRALLASSLGIVILVALQAPGRIVPETKLDVLIDPFGFLSRSLAAWDPSAAFGRVQNQAVGYLFPMGAFSALGRTLGLEPWLVQRLWIAGVITVSLWGAHRLARAIGITSPAGRVTAAWCYALAPATMSLTAFQSAGQLPYALAPLVLVPLVEATPESSPRRVAARSALWVAAMGGVNGGSTLAVLPLVAIWFTTCQPGPLRRRLAGWWIVGAAAAMLWWLVPLAVSVRYGIRFTDFTESAFVTTLTESGTEVLRGTGNWLSFLDSRSGYWLPGGYALSASRVAVVGSVLVAAGGLVGLARRDAPGRSWLVPSFLVGFLLLGIGYSGAWSGPFSGIAHAALDGPLAPFRNVHKFSALVRLPLAMGLGHLVGQVVAGAPARVRGRRIPRFAAAMAPVAIVLAIAPAAAGNLVAPGSFDDVPAAWRDAGAWLEANDDGRVLVLPGSAFGEYTWGRPLDEPLGSVTDADWAIRDLIPLGGNGSTRVLDGLDAALAQGALPDGFVVALQRAGVSHVLVRNDLDLDRTGGPRPETMRRMLTSAPELELVASFGPVVETPGVDDRVAPTWSDDEEIRQIDIYSVPDPAELVTVYPVASAVEVSGGPESVVQMDPASIVGRAMLLPADAAAAGLDPTVHIGTDSARRVDVRFGSVRNNVTYTLTPDQLSPVTGDAPVDRWPNDEPTGLTDAVNLGAATLTASHQAPRSTRPEFQPYAAFDDDPTSAWLPEVEETGQWLQVSFDDEPTVGEVTVTAAATVGPQITRLAVSTGTGEDQALELIDGTGTLDLAGAEVSELRFTIDEISDEPGIEPAGLASIDIEGVTISRPLVVAPNGDDQTESLALSRERRDPFSWDRRDEDVRIDREFTWTGADAADLSGTASAVPGPALDALLATALPAPEEGDVAAEASSRFRDQPAFSAASAIDGDPSTRWVSDLEPSSPVLDLQWNGKVVVDSLRIATADVQSTPVTAVTITVDGEDYERTLDPDGWVELPSVVTGGVRITFAPGEVDADHPLRVGVSEVELPSLLGRTAATPDRDAAIDVPCGDGPAISLDGTAIDTSADATAGALLDARPIPWQACDEVTIEPGQHRLRTERTTALQADTVTLTAAGPRSSQPTAPARTTTIERWGDEDRAFDIGPGEASIVATTENANDGWVASIDGTELEPIRVDGWRQGWIVPAGEGGTVTLTYAPGTFQRIGLVIGALALLALVVAAWGPRRRRLAAQADVSAEPLAVGSEAAVADPSGERLGGRPWPRDTTIGVGVAVGVAIGGIVALAVGAVLALPKVRPAARGIAVAAVLAAGTVTFIWAGAGLGVDEGTFSGPAQALATTAIVAFAFGATASDRTRDDHRDEPSSGGPPAG